MLTLTSDLVDDTDDNDDDDQGVRLKMDDMGNVIIKRMSNCDVFIRGWDRESNSLSKDIVELSGELEFEKSVKLFDMKKFQAGIARELLSAYPDRRKLENQCICAIAFVKDAPELLDLCSWVMLINIVALDLLKSRFPTMLQHREEQLLPDQPFRSQPKFVSVFDQSDQSSRGDGSHLQRSVSDEDPYSLPLPSLPHAIRSSDQNTSGNSGNNNNLPLKSGKGKSARSSEPKPPELPPRDFAKIKKSKTKNLPQAIKSLVKSNNKSPGKQMMEMTAEEKRRQEIEYGMFSLSYPHHHLPDDGTPVTHSLTSLTASGSSTGCVRVDFPVRFQGIFSS